MVKRCSELTAQQACSHLLLLLVWVPMAVQGAGTWNSGGLSPQTPLEDGKASWPHRAQPTQGWGPLFLPRQGLQKAGDLGSPGCLCSAGGWMFALARPERSASKQEPQGAWVTMKTELSCWSTVTQWPRTVPREPGWLSLWSGVLALRSLLPGLQTTMAPRSRALALGWGEGRSWPGSCLLWAHLSQPGPRPLVCTSTPHPSHPTGLGLGAGAGHGAHRAVASAVLSRPGCCRGRCWDGVGVNRPDGPQGAPSSLHLPACRSSELCF